MNEDMTFNDKFNLLPPKQKIILIEFLYNGLRRGEWWHYPVETGLFAEGTVMDVKNPLWPKNQDLMLLIPNNKLLVHTRLN